MTIAELLALLGRAWSRLALYPGGLAALAALWLADLALARGARGAGRPTADERSVAGGRWSVVEDLSAVVLPWLAVALLPLPYARPLERPLDAAFALALLEWPHLLAAARDLRAPGGEGRAVRRLAAALNSYPPLVLALLVLAQGVGSLELGLIAAGPADDASPRAWAMFLAGAAALALVLPAAIETGPFAVPPGREVSGPLALGLRLRALGYVLAAALPWLALLPPAREDGAPAVWLAPLPPLVLGTLAWGFGRIFDGRRARPWAWACLWLSAALLAALLADASAALRERLT